MQTDPMEIGWNNRDDLLKCMHTFLASGQVWGHKDSPSPYLLCRLVGEKQSRLDQLRSEEIETKQR